MHTYSTTEFTPVNAASCHSEVEDVFILAEFLHRPKVPCGEGQAIQVFDVWAVCISDDFAVQASVCNTQNTFEALLGFDSLNNFKNSFFAFSADNHIQFRALFKRMVIPEGDMWAAR